MSKLLINEPPLQVLPSLATEIGLNEAIVVQQLHYWLRASGHEKSGDGRRWVYNTYAQWQSDNFPFWSVRTIQSTFLKLEEAGLIESTDRFNADVRDRTKWYTVNYEHPILSDHDANPASPKSAQGLRGQDADPAPSSIKQRLHTEITPEMWGTMFDEFWATYPKKMDKGHARKAWMKLTPNKELFDTILASVKRHTASPDWTKEKGKFIPYPATWIRGEGWCNEIDGKPSGVAPKPADQMTEREKLEAEYAAYENDWTKGYGMTRVNEMKRIKDALNALDEAAS